MAVIPLASPYSLKAATMSIATDDYTAALSQVQFDPSTTATTWRGIGGNVVRDQTIAEWTATLGFAQDLDTDGLLRYLHENEGDEVVAVFTPKVAGPTITATIILSPGAIGGSADGNIVTGTATLAVVGKPAFADPV